MSGLIRLFLQRSLLGSTLSYHTYIEEHTYVRTLHFDEKKEKMSLRILNKKILIHNREKVREGMIERDILSSIWCYCNIGLVQQRMGKPIEAKNIIDKSKGRKIQFISTQIHI